MPEPTKVTTTAATSDPSGAHDEPSTLSGNTNAIAQASKAFREAPAPRLQLRQLLLQLERLRLQQRAEIPLLILPTLVSRGMQTARSRRRLASCCSCRR
jgi:hypothetical protein